MCCPMSDRVFQGIGSPDKVITVGHHVLGELDLGFAKPIILHPEVFIRVPLLLRRPDILQNRRIRGSRS